MRLRKTDRKRGIVFHAIRSIAQRRRTFTIMDLPLGIKQAHDNVQRLVEKGEIIRIKAATQMGDWVIRAVYKRTDLLRKPELTNKHL